MKRVIIAALAGILLVSTYSCSRDSMSDLNTNPDLVITATPEWLLSPIINGIVKDSRNDVIEKYEVYGRWMQYVSTVGNVSSIYYSANWKLGDKGTSPSTNYYKLYSEGRDIEVLLEAIKVMSPEDQAKRQYLASVARVLKVYLAWKSSDVCGDIPYTEANRARFGGTMTPKYDSQKELYKLLDATLKEQAAVLSSTLTGQVSAAEGDFLLGYVQNANGGAVVVPDAATWASRWAKFANTLRLKIALRYQKRDAANFTAVLNDVAGKIISSASEEAVYISNKDFTNANEDDINRIQTNHVAAKSFVDYMLATNDPRLKVLVIPNMYGPENLQTSLAYGSQGWTISSLKDSLAKLYAAGKVKEPTSPNQYFVGYTSNPFRREVNSPYYNKNYTQGYVEYAMGSKTVKVDTISRLETSIWFKGGLGGVTDDSWRCIVPVISYADVCFMCAEITERGLGSIGGKSAKAWYEEGVQSSMDFYKKTASNSGMMKQSQRVADLSSTAIASYMANPIVAYAGTTEEKLEKIALQAWVHFYRQPEEAWSNWRRTGFPRFGASSVFGLEKCYDANNVELFIPRRAALPKPTATGLGDNTANWKAALANMDAISSGQYFNGVGTVDNHEVPSGRVWWDMK